MVYYSLSFLLDSLGLAESDVLDWKHRKAEQNRTLLLDSTERDQSCATSRIPGASNQADVESQGNVVDSILYPPSKVPL